MRAGGHQLHPPGGHTRGPQASAATVWRVQVGRGLQTCMRCLAMFRRQYYLMHGSVRGPMVRLLCQVRAAAAVAGQRGAGRRGDALPPLHTPRHGGHAAHHPHRLHAVGAVDMCRYECRYYLYYLNYLLPRRHIITPSTALPEGVWLALVARGCRLQMNAVDPVKVMRFIKEMALKGPKVLLDKTMSSSIKMSIYNRYYCIAGG